MVTFSPGVTEVIVEQPSRDENEEKGFSFSCIWCLQKHRFMSNEMNHYVFVGENTKLISEERFIVFAVVGH